MLPAVRPLRSLSMARGYARIDSRPDTEKIGSAGRLRLIVPGFLLLLGFKNVSTRHGPLTDLISNAMMTGFRAASGCSKARDLEQSGWNAISGRSCAKLK